jgi:hypothetical protein
MYKKKMLSLAAIASILSTGALAFDTNQQGDLLRFGGSGTAKGAYEPRRVKEHNLNVGQFEQNAISDSRKMEKDSTIVDAKLISKIKTLGEGKLGDALIFPAFFGGLTDKEKSDPKRSNWSSEFSVINTSDKAIVAKVVLYGKIASEELRDFNIYLSAHDVFRARLENGRLISSDGSTVGKAKSTKENDDFHGSKLVVIDDKNNYKYDYDCEMSNETELNITIDPDETIDENTGKKIGDGHGLFAVSKDVMEDDYEHEGYIVVFAMAQANQSYHKKGEKSGEHKGLWEDYRHLIDTCRNRVSDGELNEWKDGIQEGIYTKEHLFLPNVYAEANGTAGEVISTPYQAERLCNTVFNSEVYKDKDGNGVEVKFSSPENVLTGSIIVSQDGSDGLGTRAMLLKAYAIDNFTDDDAKQMLLWTEGEFAHIADRCSYVDENGSGKYLKSCVEQDSEQFDINHTYYEYTSTDEKLSKLLVTQPYKRVLVQLNAETDKDASDYPTYDADVWHEDMGFDVYNKEKYGRFDLDMDIYDDDENSFHPTFGNFIVSPATAGSVSGVPYEVSNIQLFSTMNNEDKTKFLNEFKKGYALIRFKGNNKHYVPGIVTQMSAYIIPTKENPANGEVNWIYPYTKYYNE